MPSLFATYLDPQSERNTGEQPMETEGVMRTYLFQRATPVEVQAEGEAEARRELARWVADPEEWELVTVR